MEAITEVKNSPMLFKPYLVEAIQKGLKTQTRRLVKPQPNVHHLKISLGKTLDGLDLLVCMYKKADGFVDVVKSPYGKKGDILYIRETHYRYGKWVKNGITQTGRQKWKFVVDEDCGNFKHYDDPPDKIQDSKKRSTGWYKRSALFMPKKFARIFLLIKEITVEKVQDITEQDAREEGILEVSKDGNIKKYCVYDLGDYSSTPWREMPSSAKECFKQLWIKINGQESWDANPIVWKIDFELTQ